MAARKLLAWVDLADLCGVAGFVAFEFGISRWSTAAAWVLGGAVLMLLAVVVAVRRAPR